MTDDFEQGDWVQVWARVESQKKTHPEDLRISVDSHNAMPEAVVVVRKDRVLKPERLPNWVGRCTRMYEAYETSSGLYWRCDSHEGHGGDHEANNGRLTWDEKSTAGYFEGR